MQNNYPKRRRGTGSLPLYRIGKDGAPQMVQQCFGQSGELVEEGGEDRPPDLPEEHDGVLGGDSHGSDPPYTWQEEVEEEIREAKAALIQDYVKEIDYDVSTEGAEDGQDP